MEQLNKVEIQGIIGSTRSYSIGETKMARFSVATDYAYQNKAGEQVIETTWHNCVAFESAGRIDEIRKGARIHAFGRLRNNKFTSASGEERTVTEILVSKFEIKA